MTRFDWCEIAAAGVLCWYLASGCAPLQEERLFEVQCPDRVQHVTLEQARTLPACHVKG